LAVIRPSQRRAHHFFPGLVGSSDLEIDFERILSAIQQTSHSIAKWCLVCSLFSDVKIFVQWPISQLYNIMRESVISYELYNDTIHVAATLCWGLMASGSTCETFPAVATNIPAEPDVWYSETSVELVCIVGLPPILRKEKQFCPDCSVTGRYKDQLS
jgi:hypothetical protein